MAQSVKDIAQGILGSTSSITTVTTPLVPPPPAFINSDNTGTFALVAILLLILAGVFAVSVLNNSDKKKSKE